MLLQATIYSTIAMLEDIGSSKNSQQVFIFGTLTFSLPWLSPQRHSSTLYRNTQTCMFTCSNKALNCLRHFICHMCLAYIIDETKNDLYIQNVVKRVVFKNTCPLGPYWVLQMDEVSYWNVVFTWCIKMHLQSLPQKVMFKKPLPLSINTRYCIQATSLTAIGSWAA